MKPLFDDAKLVKTTDTPERSPVSVSAFSDPLGSGFSELVPVSPRATAVQPVSAQVVPPRVTEDQISEIGADAVGALSGISKQLLSHVRASDAGDFGKGLNSLVVLAKGLDPAQMQGKGLLGRAIALVSGTKERLMGQFASVEKQIDSLTLELDGKAALHKQRITDLDTIYNNNFEYHQRLEAAVTRCEEVLTTVSADYQVEQQKPIGDSFGAQVLADYERLIAHIEKRADDLKRAMLLSKQAAPQIRGMQDNARALVQKFAAVKSVTLPAWKNTFQLYILQLEQKQAVELLNGVDDATDEALRKSATQLRQNTVAIAQSRNRSVVSIETLTHVQQELIGSVEDVKRIDEEGRARRKTESVQLIAMEKELIQAFAPGKR